MVLCDRYTSSMTQGVLRRDPFRRKRIKLEIKLTQDLRELLPQITSNCILFLQFPGIKK